MKKEKPFTAIQFDVHDSVWRVEFRLHRDNRPLATFPSVREGVAKVNLLRVASITTCYLCETRNDEWVEWGVSFQSHHDLYREGVGRRLALQRALAKFDLDRAQRKEFWAAYLKATEAEK
jgi:hypothetical protein